MFVGLFFCLLFAVAVLLYVAWPNVRTDEQLEQDAERLRGAAKVVSERSRHAAEVVATKVGQSASSIAGKDRSDG